MEGILQLISHLPLIKAKGRSKPLPNPKKDDLMARIKETHIRLSAMRSAFECETNFDLIDAYIMEIDGLEKQYSYLIKQAKREHIAAF